MTDFDVADFSGNEHILSVTLAKQLIDQVASRTGISFKENALLKGLTAHLCPVLRRLNSQMRIHKLLIVIAFENMISGSVKLKADGYEQLSLAGKAQAERYVRFPNVAVDRIVPKQVNANRLAVGEPASEWIVEEPTDFSINLLFDYNIGIRYNV